MTKAISHLPKPFNPVKPVEQKQNIEKANKKSQERIKTLSVLAKLAWTNKKTNQKIQQTNKNPII